MDIQKVISAINSELTEVTADRLLACDPAHIYRFKGGFDDLSRSGCRVVQLSPFEVEALFYKFRQRRIDTALEQFRTGEGKSIAKSATGYALAEDGVNKELTEVQFVTLAQECGYIAKDDPFFCVDSYRSLAGWEND